MSSSLSFLSEWVRYRKCLALTRVPCQGRDTSPALFHDRRQDVTLAKAGAVRCWRSDVRVISFAGTVESGGKVRGRGRRVVSPSWQYQLSQCQVLQLQLCPCSLRWDTFSFIHFFSLSFLLHQIHEEVRNKFPTLGRINIVRLTKGARRSPCSISGIFYVMPDFFFPNIWWK